MDRWYKYRKNNDRLLKFSDLEYEHLTPIGKSHSKDKNSRFHTLEEYREQIINDQIPKHKIKNKQYNNKYDISLDEHLAIVNNEKVGEIQKQRRMGLAVHNNPGNIAKGGSFLKKSVLKAVNSNDTKDNNPNLSFANKTMSKLNSKSLSLNLNNSVSASSINDLANLLNFYKGEEIPFNDKIFESVTNVSNQRCYKFMTEDEIFNKYNIHEDNDEIDHIKKNQLLNSSMYNRNRTNSKDNTKSILNKTFLNKTGMTEVSRNSKLQKDYKDRNSSHAYEDSNGSILGMTQFPKIDIYNELFTSPSQALKTLQINKQIYNHVEKIINDNVKEKSEIKQGYFEYTKRIVERMPLIKMTKSEAFKMKDILKPGNRNVDSKGLGKLLSDKMVSIYSKPN